MSRGLEGIVRVVGGTAPDRQAFLGTGMLVEPDCLLTCKHVVQETDPLGRPLAPSRVLPYLVVESTAGQRVEVRPEESVIAPDWDLALLKLVAPLAGDIPPFLWGLTKALEPTLRATPLEVFGYPKVERTGRLWQHSITGPLLVPSYRAPEGTLSQFQITGGLPEGVSGSPVLVALGAQWAYVGTVYLGGERAATSRVIPADVVVEFLAQAGLPGLKRVDATRALTLAPGTPLMAEHLIQRPVSALELPMPYRHLEAFREIDTPYFHGRDSEIQKLVGIVQQYPHPPFIAVVGTSGSGKSSLVLAGVVPRVRRDDRWQLAVFRPGRDPFGELAAALTPLLDPELDRMQCREQGNELAGKLRHQRLRVGDVVAEWAARYPAQRLLLVVDQFEEIYTQPIPEELQRLFCEEVVALIHSPRPCTVLITLRVDFLGQVMASGPLVEAFNAYPPRFIRAMSEAELREAIEKPAWQLGVRLEDGLTERILHDLREVPGKDLRQAPGSLPLLQFALAELWRRRSQTWLTHTAYDAIGGVPKALATHADGVRARFLEQEERLRRIFVQLVRPGEGTEDTRQVATRAQIGDRHWPLVRQLADARLVVTGRDEQGQETVEVVHEALIRYWPPLQRWLEQDRAFRVWQNRLRQDMQDWQHRDRAEGALLQGVRLAEAEDRLYQHADVLDADEQEYIRTSVQHRDQELAERARASEELARLQHVFFLGLVGSGRAALLGALTRMPLSWWLGSFITLPWPDISVARAFTLNDVLQPAWHGFFGTFVGSVYVVTAFQIFLRDRRQMTLLQALPLALAGPLWGATIFAIVSLAFSPASRDEIHWQQDIIKYGYLVTSLFWGLGIALGTYLGDRLQRYSAGLREMFRKRLWGGLCGVLGFSLVSPLVLSIAFQGEHTTPSLIRRAWGDALEQCLSAWATLICFYWLQRRLVVITRAIDVVIGTKSEQVLRPRVRTQREE